ncbi:MAG: hypothetical protein ACXW5U_11465 [Thermoanaerobaculia bacterium]
MPGGVSPRPQYRAQVRSLAAYGAPERAGSERVEDPGIVCERRGDRRLADARPAGDDDRCCGGVVRMADAPLQIGEHVVAADDDRRHRREESSRRSCGLALRTRGAPQPHDQRHAADRPEHDLDQRLQSLDGVAVRVDPARHLRQPPVDGERERGHGADHGTGDEPLSSAVAAHGVLLPEECRNRGGVLPAPCVRSRVGISVSRASPRHAETKCTADPAHRVARRRAGERNLQQRHSPSFAGLEGHGIR